MQARHRAVRDADQSLALGGEAPRPSPALQATIDEDYRIHRVRLEHALEIEDDAVVTRSQNLRRLTRKRSGPYVEWLGVVQRQLEVRAHAQREEDSQERGSES